MLLAVGALLLCGIGGGLVFALPLGLSFGDFVRLRVWRVPLFVPVGNVCEALVGVVVCEVLLCLKIVDDIVERGREGEEEERGLCFLRVEDTLEEGRELVLVGRGG